MTANHPPDWWDVLHKHARDEGHDGAREPFMYLTVGMRTGISIAIPVAVCLRDVQTWVPKSTIYLDGSAYQNYVLDPDTGIANIGQCGPGDCRCSIHLLRAHAEYQKYIALCPSGGGASVNLFNESSVF